VLPVSPVATPQVNTSDRKKSTSKVVKKVIKTPVVPSYDTGSDSDGPPEQVQDTKRTTHTYWRQSFGSTSNPTAPTSTSTSPYMSDYGRQLSLGSSSFNGHSSRADNTRQIPAQRPEVFRQYLKKLIATNSLFHRT